jgi:membrane carboxypeptidase/penicillin-binding protein
VVTRQYITNLRAREARLMQSVQRYRPYSTKSNAPALPEQIASEIVNTVKGLQVYEQELAKNTTERERLTREFAEDIRRFKELKGIK